ncbi:hypoxanthine-guanine phosphoribosyltransferase [endosymbiont of Ridgeia piscesae]|uniref:Hypoxanthine phosphoribosyltransferase n=1 Tax=endosymbiont of Ridgeia piscesae TaxID=54398 RepID=A0A0T5YZZ9_9GAMM|nr:hypoxanthine-guanine phosphoribosyltransferase [endosymbiont of Ridgeia piscesae]KRT56184.1 Hypoxanthine-guanine phosphoribosyltransferase [endosymbiont of Ridgeia piscesae]KRT59537.1 hypoxanthine phosphoribosyltransferase [endosymbiont of Ridgeia piscesae]
MAKISQEEAAEVLATADLLYSPDEVERTLDRMAMEITGRLGGHDPIILCVLNGALIPSGHLLTRLGFPLRQDYIHATRYRGETSGGAELKWIGHPSTALEGETILVIDDILDEGITLKAIVEACQNAGAKEVLSAVLVEKRHDRSNGFKADFVGLEIEDRYVFGYGMDYKDYLRNAHGIYAVKDD